MTDDEVQRIADEHQLAVAKVRVIFMWIGIVAATIACLWWVFS